MGARGAGYILFDEVGAVASMPRVEAPAAPAEACPPYHHQRRRHNSRSQSPQPRMESEGPPGDLPAFAVPGASPRFSREPQSWETSLETDDLPPGLSAFAAGVLAELEATAKRAQRLEVEVAVTNRKQEEMSSALSQCVQQQADFALAAAETHEKCVQLAGKLQEIQGLAAASARDAWRSGAADLTAQVESLEGLCQQLSTSLQAQGASLAELQVPRSSKESEKLRLATAEMIAGAERTTATYIETAKLELTGRIEALGTACAQAVRNLGEEQTSLRQQLKELSSTSLKQREAPKCEVPFSTDAVHPELFEEPPCAPPEAKASASNTSDAETDLMRRFGDPALRKRFASLGSARKM